MLEFQLCLCLLVGIAASSFFAPLIASVSSWFDENRGLAVALVSVGMGVAPLTISPFTAWLITHMDWRHAQLVVAALATIVILPAALFIRVPPVLAASAADERSEEHTSELQSLMRISYAVFCLKKKRYYNIASLSL